MENNQEILKNLEKNSAQQLLFTKILCILCALVLVCSLVMMFSITGTVKELMALAQPLQELTAQVQALAAEADMVMADLGTVAESLAAADLGSIVENVNMLASESQSAVAGAMKKLDAIDIDMLNQAIRDLADVVEPLAKITRIW